MELSLVSGPAVLSGLAEALAGRRAVAPVPDQAPERYLAMLRPEVPLEEPDAAVVVATSGSTGDPKGVVLSAAAIRASAEATHLRLGGPGDWVCALPTHHVAGLMTLARALVAGTAVRTCRPDLADLPEASGRSYLSLVPAQLHRALDDRAVTERLAGYAAVLIGGAAVAPGLLGRAREHSLAAVTTYGMSETCGGCVYDGIPLPGVGVGFADGRITLSGPMVFSGYRLRPDLTAQVLRGDTVLTQDRGGWEDGRLRVVGRVDDVVISGGVNVDLARAQRICDAVLGPVHAGGLVLLAVPDERWGSRIVGVSEAPLDLADTVARLRPELGDAGLPRALWRVRRLPTTGTGKIDRVALLRRWQEEGADGNGS